MSKCKNGNRSCHRTGATTFPIKGATNRYKCQPERRSRVSPSRQTERKALNDKDNRLAYEAARREILRALYSQAQLQEQLT